LTEQLSYKRLILLVVIAWLVWATLHGLTLIFLGWDAKLAFTDSLVANLSLAAICFAAANSMRYYSPGKNNWRNLILYSSALSLIWLGAVFYILDAVYEGQTNYLIFLKNSLPLRFFLSFLLIGWMILLIWLWKFVAEKKETENRQAISEKLLKEAELNRLRQQLQPHFLFNSLNSISALVVTRPQEARKMIQQLSEFLRGTLQKEENRLIPLSAEIQQLELYLEIEKVRFGHRLVTQIRIDEGAENLQLPVLILQPIVENAIKFGLYDITGEVTIQLEAKIAPEGLLVKVTNPFDPETIDHKPGTGFGLESVQRRLFLLYSRNDLLSISRENKLFITSILIPR